MASQLVNLLTDLLSDYAANTAASIDSQQQQSVW